MAELSLMATSAFSLGIFHQEQQGLCRAASSKEFQALLPAHVTRQEILRSVFLPLKPTQLGDPQVSTSLLSEFNQPTRPMSTTGRPVLIDVQDARPDSVLFSFGIVEQCTRHEKILKFLMSGSSTAEGEGPNISLLSDLMGLHTLAITMPSQPHMPIDDEFCLSESGSNDSWASLICPQKEFYSPKHISEFVGDLSHGSMMTVHPDGQVLFTGTGAKIQDLLSIVDEFYLPKNSSKDCKKAMVVPYFTRSGSKTRANNPGSLNLHTETVAPAKSPGKAKLKPLPKKKQNRQAQAGAAERDLYRRNYFHACECLLSMILDKSRKGQMAILSLKKSGPELPQLLTQFSAGIAGTGLAVLFSVIWKVTSGRVVPSLSSGKLLNTGLGLGLVWVSWAVNALRDTIAHISRRNSSSLKLKDEDIVGKVEKSVNEILFRAAAVMAVVAFKLV